MLIGTRQLGRLPHNILAAGPELVLPELVAGGRQLHAWWIRSWDESYRELSVNDLRSVGDLAAIVYDSGVQLGAGSLREEAGSQGVADRKRELASLARLESSASGTKRPGSSMTCCADGRSLSSMNLVCKVQGGQASRQPCPRSRAMSRVKRSSVCSTRCQSV